MRSVNVRTLQEFDELLSESAWLTFRRERYLARGLRGCGH